jgi:ATP-binding cassette subfamily F protein 3
MIKAQGIQKSYGILNVLSDVSFDVGTGQCVALVGYNGTGKSTLLKIIAGLERADAGYVELSANATVGYLPQDTSVEGDAPVMQYLRQATGIEELEREMDDLAQRLDDQEGRKRYGALQTAFDHMDGYSFEHRAKAMLTGFGLDGAYAAAPLSKLSSGQKSKVALLAILLKQNDVLLLDEPTNNLDLPALIWLESYLNASKATIVLVSHDRAFIDRLSDKIIELDWRTHSVSVTNGTYTDYLAMKERQSRKQKEAFERQQGEIARLNDRASSLRLKSAQGSKWIGTDNDKFLRGFKRDKAGKSSKGARTIEGRIERMEKVERPFDRSPLEVDISEDLGKGDRDITLVNAVVGYTGGFTIGPVSCSLRFGSRAGTMGSNGSGKTTLLKTIAGYLKPISGQVAIGSKVRFGDLMQEHDSLPRSSSPLEFIVHRTGMEKHRAYNMVVKSGLNASQATESIASLSPGSRARLLLALFSALHANVLVLDEPTNHMDIEAMEAMESALMNYKGTLIVVSHDRYFMERLVLDDSYLLQDGRLEPVRDFAEYLASAEKKAQQLLKAL